LLNRTQVMFLARQTAQVQLPPGGTIPRNIDVTDVGRTFSICGIVVMNYIGDRKIRRWPFTQATRWVTKFFCYVSIYSPVLSTARWRHEIHSSKAQWRNNFSRFSIESVIAEKSSSAEL
jgi:hypothetical protein